MTIGCHFKNLLADLEDGASHPLPRQLVPQVFNVQDAQNKRTQMKHAACSTGDRVDSSLLIAHALHCLHVWSPLKLAYETTGNQVDGFTAGCSCKAAYLSKHFALSLCWAEPRHRIPDCFETVVMLSNNEHTTESSNFPLQVIQRRPG